MTNKPLTKEELDRVNEIVSNTVADIYLKIADEKPITEDEAGMLSLSAANGMFLNIVSEVMEESKESLKDPVRKRTVEHVLSTVAKKFQARRLHLTMLILSKLSEEDKQSTVDRLNTQAAPKKKIVIKE